MYKNRLNHPAPHFPKYCPSPLQTAVRTGKIQGSQTALNKIGVQKPPKSSRPTFSKVLPSRAPHIFQSTALPSPLQTAVRTGKIQGSQTAQFNRCLWRWQEDEKAKQSGHPESSQGPSDFCTVYSQMLYQLSYSRNGMLPQATTILLVTICCTSRGRDDLERFFDKNNSTRLVYKNRLNHPAPHFPKYCPPEPSADSGTDRQDTRLTNSTQQDWCTKTA